MSRPMKQSGLSRLPELPTTWTRSKLGFEARVKARLGWKGLTADEYVDDGFVFLSTPNIKGREIDFERVNYITRERYLESPEIMLREGDVLLTKDGFTLGTTNVVRHLSRPATLNGSIALVRPKPSLHSIFLYYFFASDFFQHLVHLMKDGMDILHLFQADLRHFDVLLPPLAEQRAIGTFLDRKTAALDALIARKERLIELLQEKRQAVITQAVTKGLDPSVPMKESGVEWLGAIPSHWVVHELRHRIRRIEQGWSPACANSEADEGEWGVLKVGCVNYGGFRDTENKALPLDLKPLPELEVRVGDVLVSRANTRDLVGSAAYVERTRSRLLLCDKLFRIHYRPSNTDPRFLVLLLQSDLCRFQFERDATGASGSMQNIGQDSVRRLLFGWAPLEEQRRLVLHVAARTAQIDALKSRLEAHCEKLREYRQALITAAVTGKIDVSREAA